ncbi:M15 family metallopeptidase [Nesterenkonia sp. F]|uniref:M15 family metallopeptidase n=1 Tax=Nesterenkonia sp. F TaxID=795955 RepID=UPI000255D51E|nr:M15 family metallopeptidase [Nesterenkonia sp. F]
MAASPSPAVRARRRLAVTLLALVLAAALGLGAWRLVAGGVDASPDPAADSGTASDGPSDGSSGASSSTASSGSAASGSAGDSPSGSSSASASADGDDADADEDAAEDAAEDAVSSASRNPESKHVLVNRRNPLQPQDYEPEVRVLDVEMVYAGQEMRPQAADALEELFAAAEQQGHTLQVTTAYRTYSHQKALYDQRLEASGREVADEYTARPGYSEHQTGLAVDVTSNHDCQLQGCFGDTAEGRWVAEHAAEHGFVIRYPEGDADITGYSYEPWHLRYVGVETARAVQRAGVTLEEYWGEPAAAEYPDAEG